MTAAHGDLVRLTRDLDGLPRGMRGVIFGHYGRQNTYAVLFGPEPRELTAADFELLAPAAQAARAA